MMAKYMVVPHGKTLSEPISGWDVSMVWYEKELSFEELVKLSIELNHIQGYTAESIDVTGFWLLTQDQMEIVKETWKLAPAGNDTESGSVEMTMYSMVKVLYDYNMRIEWPAKCENLGDNFVIGS